jgi:hypothetical protein
MTARPAGRVDASVVELVVTATDTTAPARPVAAAHVVGLAHEVLAGLAELITDETGISADEAAYLQRVAWETCQAWKQ